MENFKYKISVIVPVYNVEKYVSDCLDSLINQTIDKSMLEVLLINDGSTDNSLAICQNYAAMFPFFKVFSKQNEGLSATRNFGIRSAQGKYMIYLDSDDTFSPETLEKVTTFFDSVYDEVDEVTFYIHNYKYGVKQPSSHFRYNYMKKTGVYDLEQYPFLLQTNINVCVKNLRENNFLFDTTPGFRQEDQEYNCRVVKDKMKIGFCAEGEYRYNRSNETSITSTVFNPMAMFEKSMEFFEKLFVQFEDRVPPYYQAMYLHDINWKNRSNILYPFHYNDEDFAVAMERILALLDRVDDSTIATFPDMDNFHRAYWMGLKRNSTAMTYVGDNNQLSIITDERVVYTRQKIELILYRVQVRNDRIKLLLSAKSPVFTFTDKPKIYAVCKKGTYETEKEINCFPSSFNYYRSKTETNKFWTFYFDDELNSFDSLHFYVEIDGIRVDTNYYFMSGCPFDLDLNLMNYVNENWLVKFDRNTFYVSRISSSEQKAITSAQTDSYAGKHHNHYLFRKRMEFFKKERPIWLYYDCKGVDKDNAYYQFIHDLQKNDGVDRYYISNNPSSQWSTIFDEEQINHVVSFGTIIHKSLYVNADKLITAFIEDNNVTPFTNEEVRFIKDLCKFEIVYLQHGILHATLPWKYSPERIHIDRIVVSSYYEQKLFPSKYGFRAEDLICEGMPRFDYLEKERAKTNRILFAPTWRQYLIGQDANGDWVANEKAFLNSDFFNKVQEFLISPELNAFLEKYDLYLDFKLHPIFKRYEKYFTSESSRVNFAENSVNDNEYSIFITDFSSYVFNFAYMKCPIIYFVPDMPEFKAGLNSYRQLDLPFEEAFGELAENKDELLMALEHVAQNDMEAFGVYADRLNQFFLPMENCCEGVYSKLI